jgi:hypothetical protein
MVSETKFSETKFSETKFSETKFSETKRCSCKDHEGPNPLPAAEFYRDKSRPDGLDIRCKTCAKRSSRRRRAAHPEYVRETERRKKRRSAASRDTASRHRQPWTLDQLEVITREGLAAWQAAAILGRTVTAVKSARQRLRADPDPAGTMHTEIMEENTWT